MSVCNLIWTPTSKSLKIWKSASKIKFDADFRNCGSRRSNKIVRWISQGGLRRLCEIRRWLSIEVNLGVLSLNLKCGTYLDVDSDLHLVDVGVRLMNVMCIYVDVYWYITRGFAVIWSLIGSDVCQICTFLLLFRALSFAVAAAHEVVPRWFCHSDSPACHGGSSGDGSGDSAGNATAIWSVFKRRDVGEY